MYSSVECMLVNFTLSFIILVMFFTIGYCHYHVPELKESKLALPFVIVFETINDRLNIISEKGSDFWILTQEIILTMLITISLFLAALIFIPGVLLKSLVLLAMTFYTTYIALKI